MNNLSVGINNEQSLFMAGFVFDPKALFISIELLGTMKSFVLRVWNDRNVSMELGIYIAWNWGS